MISAASARTNGRGWSIVSRVPLSIVFIVGTTMLAIATGALNGGTPASTIARFGYSLDHLRAGRVYVVPTSDWLVVGGKHWASMLLLYVLFAVPLEWLAGTGFLACVFFIGSWVGTVVTSLAVPVLRSPLHWNPHPDLIHQADVGGSVGTWAAAGALSVLVGHRAPWLTWPVRIGSIVYLGLQLWTAHGTADVAHVIGLCIGTGFGIGFARRHRLGENVDA